MSACDRILKNTSISLGLERWPHMCEARTKPMQLARPDKNVETSSPGREEGVSVAIATETPSSLPGEDVSTFLSGRASCIGLVLASHMWGQRSRPREIEVFFKILSQADIAC